MGATTLPLGLQCKLVSIIVHADEGSSPGAHVYDWSAARALLADPEVKAWVEEMTRLGFAPVKRSKRGR